MDTTNRELLVVENLVKRESIGPESIAIISPFRAQVRLIRSAMQRLAVPGEEHVVVDTVEQLPHLLRQAFREATSGATAPVHLDLQGNAGDVITDGEADLELIIEDDFITRRPFRPEPEPQRVREAAQVLAGARRPVIVAGGGVTSSGAQREIVELAEMLSIPVATALKAKGRTEEFEQQMNAVKRLQTEINLAPFWLGLIGKIYARIGRIEEASQLLDDMPARIHDLVASSGVARSNRGDQAAYKLLSGEVELGRKNYDEAIELFEISNKLNEGNDALESLAYGYLVSGNVDEAISKYQELIARKNLGHEAQEYWILAHKQLGEIYEAQGEV
ncbi:MAG: hypothetical protein IH788_03715, partial [Nitrospinae bacterium]|nr:hypothetical protein [Nitrospinota bacterium]